MTAVLEDLRAVPDTGLLPVYQEAGDDTARRAVLAEAARRDQADRLAAARRVLAGIRAEAECAVHAQFLEASAECRGRLLSREGMAAGIAEMALWQLPEDRAQRYASEELRDFWTFIAPRITSGTYVRQRAAESRAARIEALGQAEASASEITDTDQEGMSDDGYQPDPGPRLAVDDARPLRHVPAAEEAPAPGTGRPVRRGGRGAELGEASEAERAPARGPAGHAEPAGRERRTVTGYTTYADPSMEPITPCHLVPGFLEKGQVVLIAGQGGCGKSMLTAWWSAACTRGELPGCEGKPRAVGWVNAEDDPATSTAWRLRAAGADPSLVVDLTESEDGEPFELPRDVGRLRQAIDDNGLALVIIDPLSAVSSLTLTTVLSARKIMMPLQRAARETGCVIAVIHHETKQKGTVAGSKGLVDSVRMVLRVAPDDEVPSDRVLSVSKSNAGGDVTPVRFTITGEGTDARVTWLDRDELARRRTSWRTSAAPADDGRLASVHHLGPVPATAPAPPVSFGALVSAQAPWEPRPRVSVLARYPDPQKGAELAKRRCELHPAFRAGTRWQRGEAGDELARYVTDDGTVIRFAVAAMDDNYGTEAAR